MKGMCKSWDPQPIVINGVIGPLSMAENKWVTGVITLVIGEEFRFRIFLSHLFCPDSGLYRINSNNWWSRLLVFYQREILPKITECPSIGLEDLTNGPRSVSCDRAIRYSGFFGVRETWVLLEISWILTLR